MSVRDWDQFPVRLPDGVRDEIKKIAKANGRSMNAEIVARIIAPTEGTLSLRDWFAGLALASLVGPEDDGATAPDVFAEHAYRIADAMLKAREVQS